MEFTEKNSGITFVPLEGSLDLFDRLINGNWKPEEFLILQPGQRSIGVYDWEEIIAGAKATETPYSDCFF